MLARVECRCELRANDYVAIIRHACASKPSLGKSGKCRIGCVITGTPVPAQGGVHGARMYLPMRHIGSDKHVTVSTGTDKWINH